MSSGKPKMYNTTHNCGSASDMEKQNGKVNDDNNNSSSTEQISLGKYLKSVLIMPKSMKILCFTHLLSWMGHTSYCLYFTDFVGEAVFLGDPTVNSLCVYLCCIWKLCLALYIYRLLWIQQDSCCINRDCGSDAGDWQFTLCHAQYIP